MKSKTAILAIDTATESCSVALCIRDNINGVNNLYHKSDVAPNIHSHIILQQIDEVLAQGNIDLFALDALAFSAGPGSFTGLRIGASVIQALGMACNKPIIKVSSLQLLAQSALTLFEKKSEIVLSLIDARKQELYWGIYLKDPQKNIMLNISPDTLSSVEAIDLLQNQGIESYKIDVNNLLVVGNGMINYKDKLLERFKFLNFADSILYPNAKYVMDIALNMYSKNMFCDPKDALPTYLRNNVVHKSTNFSVAGSSHLVIAD